MDILPFGIVRDRLPSKPARFFYPGRRADASAVCRVAARFFRLCAFVIDSDACTSKVLAHGDSTFRIDHSARVTQPEKSEPIMLI